MKMWVNVDEPGKDYCQEFIYSINKKTGLEQKIWASKAVVINCSIEWLIKKIKIKRTKNQTLNRKEIEK